MIRRRFQNGCLTIKGKGQKMWVARWRETVLRADNTLGKILRSKILGPVSQISKSEARNLLANCLRSTFRRGISGCDHPPESSPCRSDGMTLCRAYPARLCVAVPLLSEII